MLVQDPLSSDSTLSLGALSGDLTAGQHDSADFSLSTTACNRLDAPETNPQDRLNGSLEHAFKMEKYLKGKEKEWASTLEKARPLRLLDLPVDVLKEIVKEVTHTNDLTSLALTHSALYHLATSVIYSRFDIVWPETQVNTDVRTGVDALTYGLSTLVMSEDVFSGPTLSHQTKTQCYDCIHCGKQNTTITSLDDRRSLYPRMRRGNDFARYTRKFSLGNGPADWVQEYSISKESGKMLGTLVALAVARMPNLETFIWDMPTGVLRDVWYALSSVGNGHTAEERRLERIWIRWHDNQTMNPPATATQPLTFSPHTQAATQPSATPASPKAAAFSPYQAGITSPPMMTMAQKLLAKSFDNVEHPNLSILPPLKSISVLEIDEMAYLDELSVLIERSLDCLRELRIGTSSISVAKAWPNPNEDDYQGPFAAEESVKHAASCGMLGFVMSKIYKCPRQSTQLSIPCSHELPTSNPGYPTASIPTNDDLFADSMQKFEPFSPASDHPDLTASANTTTLTYEGNDNITTRPMPFLDPRHESLEGVVSQGFTDSPTKGLHRQQSTLMLNSLREKQKKLRLEILELEKVPIGVPILERTIDWTVLTSLTLLNCESDEDLWKVLRLTYSPRSPCKPRLKKSQTVALSEYALRLKKVHCNNVSQALISFLKETLAPNSLEWMFLQDSTNQPSKVTIDTIYRGPLRRHRSSLKKILVDSGIKRLEGRPRNDKWKKWIFNEEILLFVTSGRMSNLRELGVAIDYRDWHLLLQRLPQIPQLRSLYIPHIAEEHSRGRHLDAKDLAMQVVDIVTLRPEIELCYLGISSKCFEILESNHTDDPTNSQGNSSSNLATPTNVETSMDNLDDDSDLDDDNHDEDDNEENDETANPNLEHGFDKTEDSEADSDSDLAESEDGRKGPRLKLREILFYDDKVSIFKARHGQL